MNRMDYGRSVVTVRVLEKRLLTKNRLERMIEDAVRADAEDEVAKLYPETNSRVLKLKRAIFKAYLDQTQDFRTSIFESKQ